MTPKERAAMQQALEALESYSKSDYIKKQHPKRRANGEKAITALREALAEQAEQEPVAWAYEYGTDRGDAVNEIRWYPNLTALHKPKPEEGKLIRNVRPLYADPLAKQDTHATHVVRTKDLTDDEKLELARSSVGKSRHWLVEAAIAADREKNK